MTVKLKPGTLPTVSFLSFRLGMVAARSKHAELTTLLNSNRVDLVRAQLAALGFEWSGPVETLPDAGLQADIDAVAAALGGES